MARPKKETVTYFPHQVNHGKTMFILEERFGNDGYAFWFKLLEILGKSEGHVFQCGDSEGWMFLVATTHVSEVSATEILDTLASLNAIDQELWQEKIIWVQNFVDGVVDVYKKRHAETPLRPSSRYQEPRTASVSGTRNRQSKVKETKAKETLAPPARNEEKRPLYHSIENLFVEHNEDFDYGREGKHLVELEKKGLAREDPARFMSEMIETFYELTESEDKIFGHQPFLPSILNSGGMWPRVLKAHKRKIEDARIDAELEDIF